MRNEEDIKEYDKDVIIKKEKMDWQKDKFLGCLNINGINGKEKIFNEEGKLLL